MATITTILKLQDRMTDKINGIVSGIERINDACTGANANITNVEDKFNKFSYDGFQKKCEEIASITNTLGNTLTGVFTIPGALLGGKMYGAASDYEAAFAGVVKTTGKSREQLDAEYEALLNITENMPIENGFVQAAATMQSAAQYGARGYEELISFTESYEKAVKSTDIQGIEGSEEIAQFLNIMDGDLSNVDRYLSTVVELGNSFATGENAIQQTAFRIARTGALAGYTTPQITALAAAISTLGLEPQAGGSAAARMIKEMQGAAEVGMQAYELFGDKYGNATELSYFISTKDNMLTVAQELDTTTDYVQNMLDAWLNLENFAEISGKTADQFAADWASNPAQSMLDFFSGIARMDESGMESALAVMERMGITEIRMSDMVAALTGRSEIFASALELAEQAYEENTALYEEYAIFADTQASRDIMMKNKAMNTMADFGENVQDAVQPFINYANSLLDIFNAISEADQDRIVKIMGALMISGPAVKTLSAAATALSKISSFIVMHPVTAGGTLTGALAVLIANLADVNGKVDEIIKHSTGIEFSFNQESIAAAVGQIEQVRSSLDLLNGNAATEEARNTSEAVKLGWGTERMLETALAYESAVANSGIEQISASYAAQIQTLEEQIINSQDEAVNAVLFAQIEALELAHSTDVAAARQQYAGALSEIFGGMVSQYPEEMRRLEAAAQQYDLMNTLIQVDSFNWDAYENQMLAEADYGRLMERMYGAAWDLGYLADSAYESREQVLNALSGGMFMNTQKWLEQFEEDVVRDLDLTGSMMAGNSFLTAIMQTMLYDPAITDNLDFGKVSGALAGAVKTADFLQAAGQASEYGDVSIYGEYLVLGLANGVAENAFLMNNAFYTLRDETILALQDAFDMHSPSRLMANYGVYLPAGIAEGVRMGETMLTAAIDAVCNAGIASAALILNHDSGHVVGAAFGRGMVQGIRSMYSSVAAAARTVANAGASAARSTLDINSPSGVTEEIGRYFGEGFKIGILRSVKSVESAAGLLADSAWSEMELSDEDAKRIRSLAEREVINHFTTAELHIDFTAQNNINSNMDLDGVVSYLEEQVAERLQMAAEGVYN